MIETYILMPPEVLVNLHQEQTNSLVLQNHPLDLLLDRINRWQCIHRSREAKTFLFGSSQRLHQRPFLSFNRPLSVVLWDHPHGP